MAKKSDVDELPWAKKQHLKGIDSEVLKGIIELMSARKQRKRRRENPLSGDEISPDEQGQVNFDMDPGEWEAFKRK